ncbi:MAG: adenylyl-sulfate kinase [Bacteroidetes bacterium]|nr:adenylyl-sulfate kinase [Bacteroidota bacterium]MBK9045508.1 adenylyl-sulfate kinase [Bacteroidota bacterium]MBK9423762.1 adenylyl-sulfate kinase [Bacteroidota bacterium]
MAIPSNIVPQNYRISKNDRRELNGHGSVIVWFTGLSGSGKSTLANAVEQELFKQGIRTYVLDGDNIRHGLNNNVDFSAEGRTENIRRIGEVSKLFIDAGVVVLTAFISPFKSDRDRVRSLVSSEEFIEVFVDCPLEICEKRDVKGLYKKARAGEIADFTGISSPFEAPENPELTIATGTIPLRQSVEQVTNFILKKIIKQS